MEIDTNKEAINLFEQSNTLLEDRKFFAEVFKTTQDDLCIFKEQLHPSFQINQWVKAKEGFSLFNMFDFTVTVQGKNYLKQIFSNPLKDKDAILQRQKSIKLLLELDSKSTQESGLLFKDI